MDDTIDSKLAWTRMIAQRPLAKLVAIGALVLSVLAATDAQAQNVEACIAAHEKAQTSRRDGKLLDAREQLIVCARDACPGVIRKECGGWLDEVNNSIPTVVVLATGPDGKDATKVKVSIDGNELVSQLDGRAIEVDPGPHGFQFEMEGADPIEQSIVIREGVKNRELEVDFRKNAPDKGAVTSPTDPEGSTPGTDAEPSRPTPTVVYVLGGVGIAGLAASGFFEASGMSKRSDLDDQGCKPYCPKDEVDAAKQSFLIGDIALGVGIATLGAATYLYLTRPTLEQDTSAYVPLDLRGVPGGGMATFRGSF